jgi:glycosyltransferase involved in cell wall biosynthesis
LDTDYNRTCKREVMGMYTHMFTDRYFKCLLPDNCKFFMNDAVRSFHETCLNAHFHDSRIMPIPINNTAPVKAMRRPFRLVSIGRLDTHMKTYNFTVPAILCELRNEGCTIHWDIYGVGNIWLLERIIKDNNVEDLVTLHGHLPYSKMGSALEGATAFLGMGTAALEAAMFGIPSIIAVAYRSVPESYGFLHDVPFGILGEPSSTWIKVRSIKSVIRDIYDANDAKYSELVKLDREAALRYDVNTLIVDFDVYCSDARDYKIVPFPLCWSAFNMLNSFRSRLFSCGPKSNVINQA